MDASDVRHLLDFGSAASERINTGVAGYVGELWSELRTRRTVFCVLLGAAVLFLMLTLLADRRRVDPQLARPRRPVVL